MIPLLMSPMGLMLLAAAAVLLFLLMSPKKQAAPSQAPPGQSPLDWMRLQQQAEPPRAMRTNREMETEADADLVREFFLRTSREKQEAAALAEMASRLPSGGSSKKAP